LIDRLPELGWVIPENTPVIGNPHPTTRPIIRPVRETAPEELVFFGRMETRKGLEIFVEAVELLDPGLRITFLGRDTILATSKSARKLVEERLVGRSLTIHDDWDRDRPRRTGRTPSLNAPPTASPFWRRMWVASRKS
jgi:hypothetical protein